MRPSKCSRCLILCLLPVALASCDKGPPKQPPVEVRRGTILKKAVATGKIEPQSEVAVRSQLAGFVGERFAKLGDKVAVGDPLVEVRPDWTRLSLIEAQRAVEAAKRAEEAAKEYVGGEHLAAAATRFLMGGKQLERMDKAATLARQEAEERLALLEQGKVRIGDEIVDLVVRAPAAGHVIDIIFSPGERVIPIGSYQAPTVLATIAEMDRLEFRGTVDEIDVGKLLPGLTAEIRVGALPDVSLRGTVSEVGLKAKVVANATLFDVKIPIEPSSNPVTIRAGYSATAEVFIEKREDVLVLPERVVEFRNGEAVVRVPSVGREPVEKKIAVGLSDGLSIEVISGLSEGEQILEREYKRLE